VPCTPPVRSFLRTDKNMTCDGCAVHSGFYDVWGSLETALVPELRRLRGAHPTLPLIAVGHSLGGAAITIAAYVLAADLGFPLDQLYTYGTPRVGNAEFAAAVTVAQKYRVTHHRDVVPHLPPEVVGFAHMAPELFYADETHNGRLCDGSGEDPDCSDQYYVTTSVWDHLHYWGERTGEYGCGDGNYAVRRNASAAEVRAVDARHAPALERPSEAERSRPSEPRSELRDRISKSRSNREPS
jgi:hypothetical protein